MPTGQTEESDDVEDADGVVVVLVEPPVVDAEVVERELDVAPGVVDKELDAEVVPTREVSEGVWEGLVDSVLEVDSAVVSVLLLLVPGAVVLDSEVLVSVELVPEVVAVVPVLELEVLVAEVPAPLPKSSENWSMLAGVTWFDKNMESTKIIANPPLKQLIEIEMGASD
jgi:hypothetical protein